MSAQAHLARSNAGMRLIALLKLYNQADFARLAGYIAEHYTAAALADADAETHLAHWRGQHDRLGRLRVEQVIAVGKHQAIVVVQAQRDSGYYALQVAVEEDYPHRLTQVAWGDVGMSNEAPDRTS